MNVFAKLSTAIGDGLVAGFTALLDGKKLVSTT